MANLVFRAGTKNVICCLPTTVLYGYTDIPRMLFRNGLQVRFDLFLGIFEAIPETL